MYPKPEWNVPEVTRMYPRRPECTRGARNVPEENLKVP